jgi:hypothetical protein
MRNQEVVLRKLERLEADLKKISYLINRDERQEAQTELTKVRENLSDIVTLASKVQINDFS